VVRRQPGGTVQLAEVYDIEPGGRRVWGEVGAWDPATARLVVGTRDRWQRRGNLWGKKLRTTTLPEGDFVQVDGGRLDNWRGIVPDIYNSMARALNFTYSLKLSSDGKWGGQDMVRATLAKVNLPPSGHRGVERTH
jgi:hypothetical protein